MALATKTVPLSTTPVDLAADAEVAAALAATDPLQVFLQNGSTNKLVYLACRPAAPAMGSRDGILLRYSDGLIFELASGDSLWAWTTSSGTASLALAQA